MIVLGIDPGSRATGFSVITRQKSRFVLLEAGVIRTDAKAETSERLLQIHEGIEAIIQKHSPTTSAIESIFSGKSAASALKLGQARGVALMTLAKYGLDVTPYHPMTVKKNVGGSGRAGKKEMIRTVTFLLGLRKDLASDAADATAIAITHLMLYSFNQKLRKR
jgi:crossover junction endodeoxyribonuclease RuvC